VREGKQLAVGSLLSVLAIEGLYGILRAVPDAWPVWATAGWIGFTIVLTRVFPTVILPWLYRTRPLEQTEVVSRLIALCRRLGSPVLGVFRVELGAETRKANAALAGLGRSRRVLVSDTLVKEFTPEEIEGVLAHELGHHRHRHITKFLLLSACGSWLAFTLTDAVARVWLHPLGLHGLDEIAGFPILAFWLSLLNLIAAPIQHGLSRHFERQADRFAVSVTGRSKAFADALRRLASLNLADPNPPRWIVWFFYDHPPITERIRATEVSTA
jgi:STE24 endopeptidase